MESNEDKLSEAKRIIQEWIDQQGHERCWYYPDLFNRLATLLEVKMTKPPALPPLAEFEEGCRKYQFEEYQLKKN
ncbi:MAG: hypothetical protein AABX02_01385 [archaeon]